MTQQRCLASRIERKSRE